MASIDRLKPRRPWDGVAVPVPRRLTGQAMVSLPKRVTARRALVPVTVLVVACLMIAGPPLAPGKAASTFPAHSPAAQVRIFENGLHSGSGTLVDRNWALTALHLFRRQDSNGPGAYSLRFGVVSDQNDQQDTANLRTIDRIVPAPQGDMALVHFADPVPEGTWTPRLATEPPGVFDWARSYTWGVDGHTLTRSSTVVYDPVATANAAARRQTDPIFAGDFPDGITPMVLDLISVPGDSGGGIFADRGTLAGVHSAVGYYLQVNGSGNLRPPSFRASFEQPVWQYRQWILDTINGAGSSNPAPSPSPGQGESPRRRLTDAPDGDLPMTLPPQPVGCDEDARCDSPDPAWVPGVLLGAGNYRGTAQARCATAEGNGCSFAGTAYEGGASARMSLGPSSAPAAPGTRQVMVWCKTTTAFPGADAPSQQVLRVSFTNKDPDQSPLGYGWWDVTPDQVGTGTGQTRLDAGPLGAC